MEHESSSEKELSLRRYNAASVPTEARILIARVADAYMAEGISYKRQREISCEAGYEVSEASFADIEHVWMKDMPHYLMTRAPADRRH